MQLFRIINGTGNNIGLNTLLREEGLTSGKKDRVSESPS
ncbi:MAG: hypothetical protein H6Q93_642 [Nitrospirae bacterium]|nr:hypothetical protein [Nitrospirota bacterium]